MDHLDKLEAEAMYIMREVAAECEKPVMLYSIGKDSSVMLRLALKAFYPEKPPFPFLHVNTTWKFEEMITFRDQVAEKYGIEMLEYINEEGLAQGITIDVAYRYFTTEKRSFIVADTPPYTHLRADGHPPFCVCRQQDGSDRFFTGKIPEDPQRDPHSFSRI